MNALTEAWVRGYDDIVSRLVLRGVSRERAEDALSSAWLKCAERGAEPRGRNTVGWLYRVALREHLGDMRRERSELEALNDYEYLRRIDGEPLYVPMSWCTRRYDVRGPRRPHPPKLVPCAVCGTEFLQVWRRGAWTRTCSLSCGATLRWREKRAA